MTIEMKAGLDIGNGYSKGKLMAMGDKINAAGSVDFPSVTAKLAQPSVIHEQSDAEVESIMSDIYNSMEASFASPLISSDAHFLFGKRALSSGKTVQEFKIGSQLSKTKQNITYHLIFASIAGAAVQAYYNVNRQVPDETIDVDVTVALSLPINEYKRNKKPYSDMLMKNSHCVHIHSFAGKTVTVVIHFTRVFVTAEGAAALVYMLSNGKPLIGSMLDDIRNHGIPMTGVSTEDVAGCMNILGIDIGEGTVNFPVFKGAMFQPDASSTLDMGYGFTLTSALAPLSDAGLPFKNRKSLADFLQQKPNHLNQKRYDTVSGIVKTVSSGFVSDVTEQLSQILAEVGAYVDLIYVYGGGATPMKDMLYPELLKTVGSVGGEISVPVLYLDSRYSRNLNREGLYQLVTLA